MKSIRSTRFIATIVVVYMLLALSWWSILLYQKNQLFFETQSELLKAQHKLEPMANFEAMVEEQRSKYQRQKAMIISEGFVFGLMLIVGIVLIFRAFKSELENARQQNNFMLSVTHELKSPIAAIKLILETFKKRNLSRDQLNEFTDHALEESGRLERLVDNVLFANKMNQQYQFNMERHSLNVIVERVILYFKKNHPAFDFRFHADEDFRTIMDDQAVEIAIRNIIDNAIKYSTENKRIEVSISQNKKQLELAIKDYGVGIPEEERDIIFTKFYRIGNEEIRSTQGTGLGLFITKKIMDAHQGGIQISDNEEGGTIFQLIFTNHG